MTFRFYRRACVARRYAYATASTGSCEPTRPQRLWQGYEHRRHGSSSGGFGVRRPLRYLAHRLELDESQVRRLAVVLDRLKGEREQTQLDHERAMSRTAELLSEGELPEKAAFEDALSLRRTSQDRLEAETAQALVHIAELLDPDQRREFAYLLSTRSFAL